MKRMLCMVVMSGLLLITMHSSAFAQYWQVGEDTANVWSLTENTFVPVSDTAYLAWAAAGNMANKIASSSELYDVIAASYPAHLAPSAPVLEANGGLTPFQAFTWRRESGLNIVYTGAPALNGRYSIDDQWLGGVMTAALLRCGATVLDSCSVAFPGGSATFSYLDKNFVPHTFSIVQLRTVVLAIENHVASLYTQLTVGLGGGTPVWPTLTVTVP